MERRHLHLLFEFENTTERTGASGFTPQDIGSLARQLDDNTIWMLTATTPTWLLVSGTPRYFVTTEDDTPTTIFTCTPTQSVDSLIQGSVYAICPASDYAALYWIFLSAYIDRSGTVQANVGTDEIYEDRAAWNVTVEVVGANVNLLVTGEAGTSVQWLFTPSNNPLIIP